MIERREKGPSERAKPPFEANWLVDEFERALLTLSLFLFLSLARARARARALFPSSRKSVQKGAREEGGRVRAGDEYKHGDGKSLLISWN